MSSEQSSTNEKVIIQSTGRMDGDISVKGIYERAFRTGDVEFEILPTLIQIFGIEERGTSEASQILLQLKTGTKSGLYQFDDPAVIHLGYLPANHEGHYETTAGAFILNIDPVTRKVSGQLLFKCMNGDTEKEVNVEFNIQNP